MKNIIILLLDGMGTKVIEENLDKSGFFNSHYIATYSSVFPPTTVASTTSILSGMNPNEHCWLGWDCYFPQIDKNVSVFTNKETGTDTLMLQISMLLRNFAVISQLSQRSTKAVDKLSPFQSLRSPIQTPSRKFVRKLIVSLKNLVKSTYTPIGASLITRCTKMDATVKRPKKVCRELEEKVKNLCDKIENALIVVTADHGHINSKESSSLIILEFMSALKDFRRLSQEL